MHMYVLQKVFRATSAYQYNEHAPYYHGMMTSSNENISRVTSPLCGESTNHRWIPLTKASEAELWCYLWSAPDQMVEQTIETPVILDAIALIMTSLYLEYSVS